MARKRSGAKKTAPIGVAYEYCRTTAFMSIDWKSPEIDLMHKLSISLTPDLESESVIVLVDIEALPGDQQDDNKSGQVYFGINTESKFRVTNLKSAINVEGDGDGFELPTWLVTTMLSTAVGTTKGVLLTKLAGTPYADLPLAIFNMKELIPERESEMIPVHGI